MKRAKQNLSAKYYKLNAKQNPFIHDESINSLQIQLKQSRVEKMITALLIAKFKIFSSLFRFANVCC